MAERSYDEIERYEANRRLAVRKIDQAMAEEQAERDAHPLPLLLGHDFLAETDDETPWRIEGICKEGYNTTVTAQFKTGKSTLMLNLIRSLVDGDPFLGDLPVNKPDGRVAYWNMEVSDSLMRDWVRKIRLGHPENLAIYNGRGRPQPLYAQYTQKRVIEWLKRTEARTWIIDPLSAILTGWPGGAPNAENDSNAASELFAVLDQIKLKADVPDLWVCVHTGREGTRRSRGTTKIDDWPDSRLVMWGDEKIVPGQKTRMLEKDGRDIEYEKWGTAYSGDETKRVTRVGDMDALKRRQASRSVVQALLPFPEGLNARDLRARIHGVDTNEKGAAIDFALALGWVIQIKGTKGSIITRANLESSEVKDMRFDFMEGK